MHTHPHASAQVNLGAIAHNVRTLTETAGTAMMTIVKADAYGHGLLPVARAARSAGAAWLGVATPAEAYALRSGGDSGPVLCWLTTPDDDLAGLVEAGVDLSASSRRQLDQLIDAGARAGTRPAVHVKLDTGLTRGGAPRSEWSELFTAAARAERTGRIEIVGVWSHLACADTPDHPANLAQIETFEEGLAIAEEAGVRPQLRHLANTPGTIAFPQARYDLVRCGIGTYGLSPFDPDAPVPMPELRPAMRLRAQVPLVKRVGAGSGISYGHTYTTTEPATLALLPLGYADGLPRSAHEPPVQLRIGTQSTAGVGTSIRGRIVGRICMDQCVISIDADPAAVSPGAEAVVFGPGLEGEPSVDDWAEAAGTINYEIVTRIGARVPRVYASGWAAFDAPDSPADRARVAE